MLRRRRLGGVAAPALVLVVLALAGCSPEVVGQTGVRLGPSGSPEGVVVVCRGAVDAAVLYEGDGDTDVGSWTAARPITGVSAWSFDSPSDPWSIDLTPVLRPTSRYTLFAGTVDNSRTTYPVEFSLRELQRVPSGEVLYQDPDTERLATASVDVLRRRACQRVG